jgi:predicted dehydrogenase
MVPQFTSSVRVGLIGTGNILRRAHLPTLVELSQAGHVVLAAFCDANPEAARAAAQGLPAAAICADHREMLAKERLDAIYLCIPPTLHTDVELIAAQQGIALLVEKPQSLRMAQAVAYNRAIQTGGILSQVGFNYRYYPSADVVRDLLARRVARHAAVQLMMHAPYSRYWTGRYELCGGTFVENTIHTVDLLRFFLGDIEAVSAFYVWRKPGAEPDWVNLPHVYNVNYRFSNGVTCNVTLARDLVGTDVTRHEVLLLTDGAPIAWSPERVLEDGKVVWEANPPPAGYAAHAAESLAFIEGVRTGNAELLRSPYGDALNSLAAVLGANISAERGGELVRLDDVVAGRVIWVPGTPEAKGLC